jgi:hypothetical protein
MKAFSVRTGKWMKAFSVRTGKLHESLLRAHRQMYAITFETTTVTEAFPEPDFASERLTCTCGIRLTCGILFFLSLSAFLLFNGGRYKTDRIKASRTSERAQNF